LVSRIKLPRYACMYFIIIMTFYACLEYKILYISRVSNCHAIYHI